jgi:hypothetical protein
MKWIRRVFLVVVVVACGLAGGLAWTALRTNNPVGLC